MKNLNSVKEGDILIETSRFYTDVVTVEKTTPTQIVVGGRRYRKNNGTLIGGDAFMLSSVHIPKDGEIERVKKKQTILSTIKQIERRISTTGITYEEALQIREILGL